MRVLVIGTQARIPALLYGGIERIVQLLGDELVRRGHKIDLMAGRGSVGFNGRTIGYRASRGNGVDRMWQRLLFQARLVRFSRSVDVVHTFFTWPQYHLPAAALAKNLVFHWQNLISADEVEVLRRIGNGKVSLVGVSHNQFKGLPNTVAKRVIYNAVPTKKIVFHERPADDKYVAYLGRINHDKGADIAIRVAKHANMRLKIGGTVNDEPGAKKFFAEKIAPSLGAMCEYVGPLDDRQKNIFLGRATAVLCPARWEEPFGIVIPESLACGTPVLGTRRGALPELIDHGTTGMVCDDDGELIEALRGTIKLSRHACRAAAENRFSEAAFGDAVCDMYKELLCGD